MFKITAMRIPLMDVFSVIIITSILSVSNTQAKDNIVLIDDFSDSTLTSRFNTKWKGVSDSVMGGVSNVKLVHVETGADNCLRLTGEVSTKNNGGFIQAAINLVNGGGNFDASFFTGIRLVACGNGEQYSVHLRTADNVRPWQSYRSHFIGKTDLQTIELPFSEFEPYRISAPLDLTKLRRLGLVAIGRAFQADVEFCQIGFY